MMYGFGSWSVSCCRSARLKLWLLGKYILQIVSLLGSDIVTAIASKWVRTKSSSLGMLSLI